MSICYPDYRIASGHDVALANMQNLVTLIQRLTGRLQIIAPRSQPVNPFPIENQLGSGRVSGDGKPPHEWYIDGVNVLFLNYLIANYLMTGGNYVKSKEVTIYTPVFDVTTGLYKRYNAYMKRPVPRDEFEYTRKTTIGLTIPFTHLVEL